MRAKIVRMVGALVSCLACIWLGCSNGTKAGADATVGVGDWGTDSGLGMFEAWELARSALWQSPDHLPARADAVVKGGDPAAIFKFVRDEIATYPPASTGFAGAVTATRWGTRATLRGGAGTPREKANLLVSLYTQAGLVAEVVQGLPDPAKVDGHQVLLRTLAREFKPVISDKQAQAIQLALGNAAEPARPVIDPDGSKASALADSLLALLPKDLGSPFDFTLTAIPLVRVKIGSEWKYANPIVPSVAFGDSATVAVPTAAASASGTQKIHVLLEAARANAPYDRFKLVEHTYDAADVAGRRIQLAFAPPVALKTLVGMRAEDVETVVPVLSVVGRDLGTADTQRLAVVGDLLSLGGDVYTRTAGGISINGTPIASGGDPAAIARVASISARAPGSAFPRMGVTVSALDRMGANVPNLGASAFQVLEDGKPVSFSVTQKQAPAPRVVLLFDASTSIPAEFRGASAVAMGNQIVDALYAAHANAQLRVATISVGAIFATTTWATTATAAKAQVQVLEKASGSSETWQALSEVQKQRPTVIILVTDGAALDTAKPQYQSAIAAGCPILSIGVGTVNSTILGEISTLSGGSSVLASLQQQAIDAALAEIEARSREDYVISYQAPAGAATPRTITVIVNGIQTQATYSVPAVPALPNALSGLYLTLGVDGRNETVPVAGFALGFSTAFPTITQAMLDDVRSLLFGRISIAVEGAGPPLSVVLDDWISEKLSLRPLWQATQAGDSAGILAALAPGFSFTPSKLPFAQAPLLNAASTDALTFETGPRVSALLQKVGDDGRILRQLDLFPLSRWATAAADPRVAWERTLKTTAGLAVVESALFAGASTLASLAGKTFTRLDAGQARNQAGLSDEERRAWAGMEDPFNAEYQLLVPLKPGPFWAIHEGTGTVIGVLPDGTGGGVEEVCATYSRLSSYLSLVGLVGGLAGASLGGWTALAQWEVDSVTMATLVIGYGTEAKDIQNPALAVGCGIAQDQLGNRFPPYSKFSDMATSYGLGNPDFASPTECPHMKPCH
jgi:hypothetical protein